jgi:hypothetical protein
LPLPLTKLALTLCVNSTVRILSCWVAGLLSALRGLVSLCPASGPELTVIAILKLSLEHQKAI